MDPLCGVGNSASTPHATCQPASCWATRSCLAFGSCTRRGIFFLHPALPSPRGAHVCRTMTPNLMSTFTSNIPSGILASVSCVYGKATNHTRFTKATCTLVAQPWVSTKQTRIEVTGIALHRLCLVPTYSRSCAWSMLTIPMKGVMYLDRELEVEWELRPKFEVEGTILKHHTFIISLIPRGTHLGQTEGMMPHAFVL